MKNMRLAALLVSGLFFALVWFNQQPSGHKPVLEQARPNLAPFVKPSASTMDASSAEEPKHYRPPAVTAAVRRKVEDFIRRFKDMPPEELAKREEFMGMMKRFMQTLDTPEFERKMDERVAAIKAAKGVQHGTLNINSEKLDSPEGRALLEAIFSEDTGRMEEFILNKLDGAIFELAFDPSLEQTTSGVSMKSNVVPAPAADKLPD